MQVINDLLEYNNMKIIQDSEMFAFSLDSILLPNFITINKSVKNIMDIGCGNGPIPLILSTKTSAKIIGVEYQKEIAQMAQESVKLNQCDKQITIINDDINDYYKKIESDSFDVITCNPPYFKVNEKSKKNQSKYKTIARHEVKLNIADVCRVSKKLLKNGGILGIVHRPERLIDIIETMKIYNLEPKKIQFIYPSSIKKANIMLIEAVKNGKPGIKIMPPIYSHNSNGEYSEEIKNFFKAR